MNARTFAVSLALLLAGMFALAACSETSGTSDNGATGANGGNAASGNGAASVGELHVPSVEAWVEFVDELGWPQPEGAERLSQSELDDVLRRMIRWFSRYPDDLRTLALKAEATAARGDVSAALNSAVAVGGDVARLRGRSAFVDDWFATPLDVAYLYASVLATLAEGGTALDALTDPAPIEQAGAPNASVPACAKGGVSAEFFDVVTRATALVEQILANTRCVRDPDAGRVEVALRIEQACATVCAAGLALALDEVGDQGELTVPQAAVVQVWLEREQVHAPQSLDAIAPGDLDLALLDAAWTLRKQAGLEVNRARVAMQTERYDQAEPALLIARERYRFVRAGLERFHERHPDWTLGDTDLSACEGWLSNAEQALAEIEQHFSTIAEQSE